MQESKDKLIELPFPLHGIDLSMPVGDQRSGTTPIGENVRFYESLTQRGRGGSRAGISRYINAQVSGTNRIQMLDSIVRTDGSALGWSFQGEDFEATGLYGGLDLTPSPGRGDDEPLGGGDGYQLSQSFKDNRLRLRLATSATASPINENVTITATVTRPNGDTVGLERVFLHTSRGGRVGDGIMASSSVVDGTAEFVVTDDREETVTYIATIEDILGRPVTRSRNTVKIEWTDTTIEFVQGNSDVPPTGAFFRQIDYLSDVTAGNLLVLVACNNYNSEISGVGDGSVIPNIWVKKVANGISLWYVIANSSGPLTVGFNVDIAAHESPVCILEYSGVSAATPTYGTATLIDSSGTPNLLMGPIAISESGELVIAALEQFDFNIPFTAGASWTSRCNLTDGINVRALYVQDKIGVDQDPALIIPASLAVIAGRVLGVMAGFKKS